MTSPFYKLSIASKDLTSLQYTSTCVLQLRSAVSKVYNCQFFWIFWTIFDLFFWTCTVPVSKANFSASIAASVKAFVSDGQAKKPFVLQITLQSYDASRARWPADVSLFSLFSPNCLSNTMGRELFSKKFFWVQERIVMILQKVFHPIVHCWDSWP